MSLLRLCGEFDDLANKYVVMITSDGKPPRVLSGRARGGYSVGSHDISKAKLYNHQNSAETDADILTGFYEDIIDEHTTTNGIQFTSMPYGEAKAMLSGGSHPYR